MSATDELRRLLDKRGVEHSGNDANVTHWLNYAAVATEQPGKVLWLSYYVTPEEAVNITLGRGTCENIAQRYLDFLCSKCGFVHYIDDSNCTGDGNEWNYCPKCGKVVSE